MFSVLDLRKAYLQLELDEHAQELLTVNTHMGLFRCRRLPCCIPSVAGAMISPEMRLCTSRISGGNGPSPEGLARHGLLS